MQPDRPVQTTLAFHASRIVIDVGVLLAMASMSLTFVSGPDGGRSALAADALPAVLLLIPIFLVTLIPDHTRPLHPALGWASMVLALAALPYSLVKLLDAGVLADTLGGSVGFGPILLVIGCLVTLAGIGVGVVRDLLGKPSGGTPQRHASYETKRSAGRAGARTATAERPAASGPAGESTTILEPTAMSETIHEDEAVTRIVPAADTDAAERDASPPEPVPPLSDQPEILFPDTGAVAREAEPAEEPLDARMDTAERADAALTESLLSMFDDDPADDERP